MQKERVMASMVVALLMAASPVTAAENVTYIYDALGRLVKTHIANGPNDQLEHTTTYDPAGNRSNYKVTGARRPLIVLPLNGFTVISPAQ